MAIALYPAVFLDKDGTLVDDVPFNVAPARIRLARGAEALAALTSAGYRLIVVSNQPGIAQGYFSEAQFQVACTDIAARVRALGAGIDDFYYCPHAPHADGTPACRCRKPNPGLLFDAAHEHDIALAHSWFVGDILNDVEAGRRAGCRTILINNGNETEWRGGPEREPHYRAADLAQAVDIILRSDAQRLAV